MIEGLYLSTFFDIGPLKNLLDIRLRHDHGAALWELDNGTLRLRRYWEFERISGLKQHSRALYDQNQARHLLQHLLAEEDADLRDVVEIWGTPGIETSTNYQRTFGSAYAFHGMAHLMTALFCQNPAPLTEPMVAMSLDAGPDCLFEPDAYDRHYYPGCVIDERGLRMFPCESPGRLWSYASKKFGLREGTLMALASASDDDAELDLTVFDRQPLLDLSARRAAADIVDTIDSHVRSYRRTGRSAATPGAGPLTPAELHVSAVMQLIARLSLRIVRRNLDLAETEYGADLAASRLALAGGFALNCPTNSQLLQDVPFTGYQIPPCTSDSGIALGTGLAAFYPQLRSGAISTAFDTAYYGQGPGDLAEELDQVSDLVDNIEPISADGVAELLAREGIIAWVNGTAEIGPRALGNRSLLADPRSLEVKNRLNQIKQRQWWRPVAPLVLDQDGPDYFRDYRHSPYMLLNFHTTAHAQATVPGVLHLDHSARAQSVSARTNPDLARVLHSFKRQTGVSILGNTSLNDADEPIINRLSEAVHFAAGKGIRSLVANATTLITLHDNTNHYAGPRPRQRRFFETPAGADTSAVVRELNPHDLDQRELTYFYDNPALFGTTDIRIADDAKDVRSRTEAYLRENPGALDRR
ncbi:carbamoyltransferase C-terminal domain-containing protein [Nocardia fluminea]|uniref:Carbamoyltransferase-like protein n=1 Tax=Nocardia fluminea TaxID=134984 RepID=A0A2N3VFU2_9NOCA|nr:carbamoyltransferase C-terminal domain-containing protein [Nocardia fluminea]PKV80477.1 carbamoyltransferase-like protein [Nocardia fluminea]